MLFVSIYKRYQSPESVIVINDFVVYFKKEMAPFGGTFMTARNNEYHFYIIIIEARKAHAKVEVTVTDKSYILRGFAIEFRAFCNL